MNKAPQRLPDYSGHPPLSSAQKAAIVLASLPRETAAAIVAEVGDAHLRAFVHAVSEMKSVPAQTRLVIAQEFIAEVLRRKEDLPGGSSEAHRILAEITDAARTERVLGSGQAAKPDLADLWRQAGELPTDRLLAYLREQRPPSIAAILANLPSEKAAEVLSAAAPEFSKLAIASIARFSAPDPEITEAIATAIKQELLKAKNADDSVATPSEPATAIFDLLPSSLREGLIAHLESEDAPMAAAIRRTLLTFEQLPNRLTEAGVSALFRAADRDALMRALKHSETSARAAFDFLLANISKRMADQFREDLAAIPASPADEGEAAQRAIISTLKRLEKSGEIKLKPVT
jgi:flagellar motor switch protein FliG